MSVVGRIARHCREIEIQPRVVRSGVYILIDRDEVVYIGSSQDVEVRIRQHRENSDPKQPRKTFDRVLLLEIPLAVHPNYEGALIRALRPKWCGSAPADRGDDAEILEGMDIGHLIDSLKPFGRTSRESMRAT